MGVLTPEILENMAKVARKYEIPIVKITSAQRSALVGIKPEDVDSVWKDLGMEVGSAEGATVHYVQACPGTETCKFGQGDSLGLAGKLEKIYVGRKNLPAKTKISISGCNLNCAESYLKDIGAFATNGGWTVVVGGNSGGGQGWAMLSLRRAVMCVNCGHKCSQCRRDAELMEVKRRLMEG